MGLALNRETLDGLPAEVAGLYIKDETTGGFALDVDANSDALHHALKVERDARKSAERAVRAVKTENSAELKEAREARDKANTTAQNLRMKLLDNRIIDAARAAGLHQKAIADAVRKARSVFDLDDELQFVTKDGSSMSVVEFFEAAKEDSPHWYPAPASGGGAQQGVRETGSAATIKRSRFESLHPQQKAALLRDGTKIID